MSPGKRQRPDVPPGILAEIRSACLALPEAYEEAAWVGTRWRIRSKTFAHVLMVDSGWPPAYARAAGSDGPICVLTFRSWLAEFESVSFTSPPYFRPRWWPDIVGMIVDARTDWEEVASLVAASYRVLAPKKLAGSIAMQGEDPDPSGPPLR